MLLVVFAGNDFPPSILDCHMHKNGGLWSGHSMFARKIMPLLGKWLRISLSVIELLMYFLQINILMRAATGAGSNSDGICRYEIVQRGRWKWG